MSNLPGPAIGAPTLSLGKKPLIPAKKKLTDKSSVPSVRPLQSGSIELPLLAPTGPQAGVRNSNRQTPPPLPLPSFPAQNPPQIPSSFSQQIKVNPSTENPINTALNLAADGALVVVPAGDYKESLKITKNVHFRAEGTVRLLSDTILDVVNANADIISFDGFTFRQEESQSAGAAIVNVGSTIFKNCTFYSHFMPTVIVKSNSKAFLYNCSLECQDTTALLTREDSYCYCEDVTFTAPKANGVMTREKSVSKFVKCSVKECGRNSFTFMENSKFLFENSTIDKNFDITAQSSFGMVRGCTVSNQHINVHGSATTYFVGCTFNRGGLNCYETSGVRICDCTFTDQTDLPGIVCHGDSTIETHNNNFNHCKSGAAIAIYNNGEYTDNSGKYYDLNGVAFLAYGAGATLDLQKTAIVNATNGAVVAHTGAKLKINETLIDKINNAGILLNNANLFEIKSSKLSNCHLSAIDATAIESTFSVDHCIFDRNGASGIIANGNGTSTIYTITNSDFTNNKQTGIDIRNCTFSIDHIMQYENENGGLIISENSNGTLDNSAFSNNGNYSICSSSKSSITIKQSKLIQNLDTGVYVISGARATLIDCDIRNQDNIALLSENSDSKLIIEKCIFIRNSVAVQSLDQSVLEIVDSRFEDNGIHVEIGSNARGTVNNSNFQLSANGIGINIGEGGSAVFNTCEIQDEAKVGIANGGNLTITNSTIEECGITGIYWYGNSSGEISSNKIYKNGPCGIQIMKGEVSIHGNTIKGHHAFGIHADKESNARIEDNEMSDNLQKDINYEGQEQQ